MASISCRNAASSVRRQSFAIKGIYSCPEMPTNGYMLSKVIHG